MVKKRSTNGLQSKKAPNTVRVNNSRNTKQNGIVVAPVSRMSIRRRSEAAIKGLANGNVRIAHKEYLMDIQGNTSFTITRIEGNPGLSASFPWLSNLCLMFERYKVHKLRLCYETMKSTATNGTVLLAVDYDAKDDSPSDKTEMMAFKSSVRCPTWHEVSLDCKISDLNQFVKERYLRSADLTEAYDIKTYDFGNMYIAVQGQADTSLIGEIYLEYDIELLTPQLNMTTIAEYRSATLTIPDIVAAAPFSGKVLDHGNIIEDNDSNIVTFKRVGNYLINYFAVGEKSGAGNIPFDPTLLTFTETGCEATVINGAEKQCVEGSSIENEFHILIAVKVLTAGAQLIMGSLSLAAAISNWYQGSVVISSGVSDAIVLKLKNRANNLKLRKKLLSTTEPTCECQHKVNKNCADP